MLIDVQILTRRVAQMRALGYPMEATLATTGGGPVDEVGQNTAKGTDSEHPWRH